MLPELVKIFEIDEETLFVCRCTLVEAIDIVGERGLHINSMNSIVDDNKRYAGHWATGLLKLWVPNTQTKGNKS